MPSDTQTLILKNPADVVRHLIAIQYTVSNVQLNNTNAVAVIRRRETDSFQTFPKPLLLYILTYPLNTDYSKADLLYNFSNDVYTVGIDLLVKNNDPKSPEGRTFADDAWREVRRSLEQNRKIATSTDTNLNANVKSTYDILYIVNDHDLAREEHGNYHYIMEVQLKIRSRALGI